MNHYERNFDTDWENIDVETASLHAYAIGVSEIIGEENGTHLDRLSDAMETGYERSVVELAFEEGKREARNIDRSEHVWDELFQRRGGERSEPVTDVPELVNRVAMLDSFDLDRPNAMELPEFLQR